MSWNEVELRDITTYRKGKINSDKLNEFNYISTDSMLPNKEGVTNAVSLPDSGNFNSYYKNDILISNIRPYFKKIWMANKDGGCSNDILVFPTDNKKIEPKFLYYQLSNNYFFDFMMAGSNGTKMPRGSKDAILKYKFKYPNIKTQKKIVNFISNYDNLIENNNKRIKLLENMAEEVYKEWFVRLRFPDFENVEIIDGVPDGWSCNSIKNYVSVADNRGKTPPIEIDKTEYPIIEVNALGKDSRLIDYSVIKKYVDKNIFDTWFRNKPEKYDTLISTVGSIAELSMFVIEKGNIAQNIVALHGNNISQFYLYQVLKSKKKEILMLNIGGTQPSIKVPHILGLKIIMPDEKNQILFDKLIKPIVDKISLISIKNQNLKQTRDLLLPRLINGKLNIEDLEIE